MDLTDPAEVLKYLAAISDQILNYLRLKLKKVTLPCRAYSFRNVSFYIKVKRYKS